MNEVLRLFVALPLDPPVIERLTAVQRALAAHFPRGEVRWVRPNQMHLTLRFLGDVAASRVGLLTTSLRSQLSGAPRIDLLTGGIGAFPSNLQPRVIWVGLNGGIDELHALQSRVHQACIGFGRPAEDRPFQPHLTLGRLGPQGGSAGKSAAEALANAATPPPVVWPVSECQLVRSRIGATGPVYSCVERFALAKGRSLEGGSPEAYPLRSGFAPREPPGHRADFGRAEPDHPCSAPVMTKQSEPCAGTPSRLSEAFRFHLEPRPSTQARSRHSKRNTFMIKPPRCTPSIHARIWAFGLTLAALIGSTVCPSAQAQATPKVVAVSPATGATGVAVTTTLAFTFDLEMDDSTAAMPSMPPFLVGNMDFQPASVATIQDLASEWSEDKRTLTCTFQKDLPAGTKITWTLNPAGTFLPITSADGVKAATTTGSFTTAGSGGGSTDTTAPILMGATPTTGTTNFPIDGTVKFTFSEPMEPTASPSIAWTANVAPGKFNAANFTYKWEAADRTLACRYTGNFPTNALVSWKLNPTGGANTLKDAAGNPLAPEVNAGSFTTGQVACAEEGTDNGNGTVMLAKSVSYDQKSDSAPVLAVEDPAIFNAMVASPDTNAVTAVLLKNPKGSSTTLSNLFGPTFMAYDVFQTETALDQAWPAGPYTAEITRTTGPKVSVPVLMSENYPPTPRILNYTAAQAVNPTLNFVLSWNGIPNATSNDFISLTIRNGDFTWHAPEPCVPRPLPSTATSIEIPAGTLTKDTTYTCDLAFGRVGTPNMSVKDFPAFASLTKQVNFQLKTSAGTVVPPTPPTFTRYTMLSDGQFELVLKGEANRTYVIERTAALGTTWTTAATKQAGADGTVTYKDPRATEPMLMFYRAKAQ